MAGEKRLNFFERYLSVWVGACIVVGIVFGKLFPGAVSTLSKMEISHVNLPIAVLIWLMIYPMMLKIDFSAILKVGDKPKGLLITLFVNWIVKPFSMAFLGWLFFKYVFIGLIGEQLANEYIAGVIYLGGGALYRDGLRVEYLTDGDPAYPWSRWPSTPDNVGPLRAYCHVIARRFQHHRAQGRSLHVGLSLYRHPAGGRLRDTKVSAERERRGVVQQQLPRSPEAGHHHGATGHPRHHLRLPGRGHPEQLVQYYHHRRADHHSGIL
jgi:hypothetical protein